MMSSHGTRERQKQMAIDFRQVRANFPSTTGKKGVQNVKFEFGSAVRNATVAIKGFRWMYDNQSDHNVGDLYAATREVTAQGRAVSTTVDFLIRDWSNNIDDAYSGWVDLVCIADVV
jgi:hypothetical protein